MDVRDGGALRLEEEREARGGVARNHGHFVVELWWPGELFKAFTKEQVEVTVYI